MGRDISGARSPSPTAGPTAQGSNAKKVSPHNFWLQKRVVIESVEEMHKFKAVPLKEPTRIYSSSSTGVAASKAPVTYGEELKCLASR